MLVSVDLIGLCVSAPVRFTKGNMETSLEEVSRSPVMGHLCLLDVDEVLRDPLLGVDMRDSRGT